MFWLAFLYLGRVYYLQTKSTEYPSGHSAAQFFFLLEFKIVKKKFLRKLEQILLPLNDLSIQKFDFRTQWKNLSPKKF